MNFVRPQLSLAILHAVDHSIRGARKKLMPFHFEDGIVLSITKFCLFGYSVLCILDYMQLAYRMSFVSTGHLGQ